MKTFIISALLCSVSAIAFSACAWIACYHIPPGWLAPLGVLTVVAGMLLFGLLATVSGTLAWCALDELRAVWRLRRVTARVRESREELAQLLNISDKGKP